MSVTDPTEAVDRPQDLSSRPTAGVDWATDDHAVAVVAPDGEQTLRFPVTHDAAGLRTGVILSGGNVDVARFRELTA